MNVFKRTKSRLSRSRTLQSLAGTPQMRSVVVDTVRGLSGLEPIDNTTFITQQDVNEQDEERRKAAMHDLVESWMDRLQLISVITTFFASTEAGLLTITTPSPGGDPETILSQVTNVGLIGALVVHSSAAIISFLAAFILIRHKLKVAKQEEIDVEREEETRAVQEQTQHATHHTHFDYTTVESPKTDTANIIPIGLSHTTTRNTTHHPAAAEQGSRLSARYNTDPVPGPVRISSPLGSAAFSTPIYSTNPHLVQVGPRLWGDQPPTHLLSHFHSLCITLSLLGFALALMGMVCFAWDRLAPSAGISASVFMAICLISGLSVLLVPEKEGRDPHIYVESDNK